MLEKVIVRNFKKFGSAEFDLSNRVVIVGPNNSGKTTLLQAIAAWSELAFQWRNQYPDLAREPDGNYPSTDLNLLRFHSIPLADFDHLWRGKSVEEPVSIHLHAKPPNNWRIGFEVLYSHPQIARVRPACDVSENDLEACLNEPLVPTYIPPSSGLDREEDHSKNTELISQRLAQAQGGRVLRNLLLAVSQDDGKWSSLQEEIRTCFGYELLLPSAGAQVLVQYRHHETSQSYELNSAASGFLQVLMVYAALLHKKASVVLVDEPDAHLHTLLQRKMYDSLTGIASKAKSQLIISTHSEQLIRNADAGDLRVLTESLRSISRSQARGTMGLENTDIVMAQTEQKILYVEGVTDVRILTGWARVLNHRILPVLETGFVCTTAEQRWKPMSHFQSLRALVPSLCAVELIDRDSRTASEEEFDAPEGMIRLMWRRKEIENYLIHPVAIRRYTEEVAGGKLADRVESYMQENLPRILYENPFEPAVPADPPGKRFLADALGHAGPNVSEHRYDELAAGMRADEIHPEVIEKLDAIAGHFDF